MIASEIKHSLFMISENLTNFNFQYTYHDADYKRNNMYWVVYHWLGSPWTSQFVYQQSRSRHVEEREGKGKRGDSLTKAAGSLVT